MKRSNELLAWLRMANEYSPLIPGRDEKIHLPLITKRAVLEGKGEGKAIYTAHCPPAAQLGTHGFIFHKGRDIKAPDAECIEITEDDVTNWNELTRPELAYIIKEIRKGSFLNSIEPPKHPDSEDGEDETPEPVVASVEPEEGSVEEPEDPQEDGKDETSEPVVASVKQEEESVEEPADPQEDPSEEEPSELEIPDFKAMSKKEIDDWGNEHAGIDLDGRKSKAAMIAELMEHLNK